MYISEILDNLRGQVKQSFRFVRIPRHPAKRVVALDKDEVSRSTGGLLAWRLRDERERRKSLPEQCRRDDRPGDRERALPAHHLGNPFLVSRVNSDITVY